MGKPQKLVKSTKKAIAVLENRLIRKTEQHNNSLEAAAKAYNHRNNQYSIEAIAIRYQIASPTLK